MLTKRTVLYAKVEGSYGVDSSPSATDAILVENLTWSNEGLNMVERPGVRPSLSMLQQVFAGRLLQLTFDAEVKGSGTEGVAPEIGPLLLGCAMSETIVADTSVTYEPESDPANHESLTIYLFEDGKQQKITGCRGTGVITPTAGGLFKASFTITGHVAAQTDVSLPTPTLDSTVPPAFVGASFAVDGFSGVIESVSFDLGNTVTTPPSANGADGYGEIQIVSRDVNGSFNPEDELVATEDWLGNFISGAQMAMATGTIGSDDGNKVAISCPAVYYRNVTPGDRDGIRIFEIPYGAVESSGDDEISIVFT